MSGLGVSGAWYNTDAETPSEPGLRRMDLTPGGPGNPLTPGRARAQGQADSVMLDPDKPHTSMAEGPDAQQNYPDNELQALLRQYRKKRPQPDEPVSKGEDRPTYGAGGGY